MIFDDTQLRALFKKKGRTYSPGDVIFLEENRGGEMYIIVSGEVEISKTYREVELFSGSRLTMGSESEVLNILTTGDFFGEMALISDKPRMAAARARATRSR